MSVRSGTEKERKMEIKGDIGEEVYIKATIVGIKIYEDKQVVYFVKSKDIFEAVGMYEKDIVFREEERPAAKEEIPEEKPKKKRQDSGEKSENAKPFEYSAWLEVAIKQTGLSKTVFCSKINAWLDEEQAFGRHTGLGHFYPADLTNYINGRKNMSKKKIETIADFNKAYFSRKEERDRENDMIVTGRAKRATVESTMRKLEKMRGVE